MGCGKSEKVDGNAAALAIIYEGKNNMSQYAISRRILVTLIEIHEDEKNRDIDYKYG